MSSSFAGFASALGHPVLFSPRQGAALLLKQISAMPKLAGVTAASRLEVRPTPAMVSSGIPQIDALTGGLPRGCLTEISGVASSGRTSVMLAALAAATRREEVCALVDTTDALDPESAAMAGVEFGRLLWVRCEDFREQKKYSPQRHRDTEKNVGSKTRDFKTFEDRLDQALRVIDLLLQSGGFGLVAIDFGDVPFKATRRVPLTTWFRFQRAVEHTPTMLLLIAEADCAQTCASMVVGVRASAKKSPAVSSQLSVTAQGPYHAQLLEGLRIEAELLRLRLERKPVRSARTVFTAKAHVG